MSFFQSVFGRFFKEDPNRFIKQYLPQVDIINKLEPQFSDFSDQDIKQFAKTLRQRCQDGENLDELLPDSFALVREASRRLLDMRHFDVQLIGGMVLHDGAIAEMRTGEGKTLVATLPAFLNTLGGKKVFVVTVNDYLAKRDSKWMGQIFEFLGASVGLIQANMDPEDRKKAYQADIIYGTNNEFGFDYLRDNLAVDKSHICQTAYDFAIVDEVDSILIDEARTPLIISGPIKQSTATYKKVAKLSKKMRLDDHFTVDEKHKNVVLTESGVEFVELDMSIKDLYSIDHMDIAHMIVQCLKAIHLFSKDVDYVVKDGSVMIVDEFTGRLMEGRRFSDGLHQAIEAVEGLKIKQESQTLASVTFQNYFRMFSKLSGMTGTALTEAAEFEKIYSLPVVPIITNQPVIRDDQSDVIYKTKKGKFDAIVNDIKTIYETGQPILVGTISIENSEVLSKLLKQSKVPHKVLNAKYHEQEAQIVANAGQPGQVTIATNMAGRGTDIVLGDGVTEKGGLFVLGSERHESRRIDNQLRGRSGRQGDPGASRFYVSLEDDLMRLFGSDRISKVMDTLGMPEDMPVEHSFISRSLEKAQSKVEKYHFSIRKQLLEFDNVMNQQRETIYQIRRQLLMGDSFMTKIEEMLDTYVMHRFREFSGESNEPVEFTKESEFFVAIESVFPTDRLTALHHQVFKSESDVSSLTDIIRAFYDERRLVFPDQFFNDVLIRQVFLETVDRKWVDHLHNMDILRDGIGLRAYGQRDPLLEYKIEAFDMFEAMMDAIAEDAFSIVSRAVIVQEPAK